MATRGDKRKKIEILFKIYDIDGEYNFNKYHKHLNS